MNSVLKRIQQIITGKQNARIIEREIQAYEKDGIEKFRELLQKKLPKTKTLSKATQVIVESALLSEFGDNIRNLSVYKDMVKSITKTLLEDPKLKKDTKIIAKKYS